MRIPKRMYMEPDQWDKNNADPDGSPEVVGGGIALLLHHGHRGGHLTPVRLKYVNYEQ